MQPIFRSRLWSKGGMCLVSNSVFYSDERFSRYVKKNNRNMGIAVINCLLFADNIDLLGKSEAELQALLNITANFAT